jgi:hypothetical protein
LRARPLAFTTSASSEKKPLQSGIFSILFSRDTSTVNLLAGSFVAKLAWPAVNPMIKITNIVALLLLAVLAQ